MEDEKVPEMDGGDGCTTQNILNAIVVHLKLVRSANCMARIFYHTHTKAKKKKINM